MLVVLTDLGGINMEQTSTGLFKQKKGLEVCFLLLGIVLFLALGVRGLQRIGDMRVAAGEHNKFNPAQVEDAAPGIVHADALSMLPAADPVPTDNAANERVTYTNKNENRSDSRSDKSQPAPNNNAVQALARNVKKQNI